MCKIKASNPGFEKCQGFTIIELLVAAAIMSMVSLAILSTFSTGMHAFERVQSFGGRQADVLLFLEGFERDLRNTCALSQVKFEGTAQTMSFAAVGTKLVAGEQEQGDEEAILLGKKSYYFDNGILVSQQSDLTQPDATQVTQKVSVTSVQFQYYSYRKTVEDETEKREFSWQGTWAEEETIPKGVKINLTFQDGGREVSLARTVFIPAGGEIIAEESDAQQEGEGDG